MKKALIFFLCALASMGFVSYQELGDGFIENFSDKTSTFFRYGSTGSKKRYKVKMGKNSSFEKDKKILSLKLNPDEEPKAGKGPEIISKVKTHFGSYATRLKVPNAKDVQPNVGAVVGYFTYHEDKIEGLSEIDFEWLLADPRIIYVGTWTGKSGKLERVGRIINLAEGTIINTIHKNSEGKITHLKGLQTMPEKIPKIENYDASNQFYTYGFDWKKESIRWWMIEPSTSDTLVLWNYSASKLGIPQHASYYRMNFWYTNNWSVETNPKSIERPEKKYELEVDWMSYEPE